MDDFSRFDQGNDAADAGDAHAAPRSARDSMFLQASLKRAGIPDPLVVRVRNISAGGLMADCPDCLEPLEVGERIGIDLRGIGPVSGWVAWSRGGRLGIRFDETIDPQLTRKPVPPTPRVSPMAGAGRRPGLRPR